MLDHQKNPLMRTDVKRREIWEWSDHTLVDPRTTLLQSLEATLIAELAG
jgi:hypothetical protein